MTTSPTSTPSKLAGSKLNPPAPTFTKWTVGSIGVLTVEGVGVGMSSDERTTDGSGRTVGGGNVTSDVMVSACAITTERSCMRAIGIARRVQDDSMVRDD